MIEGGPPGRRDRLSHPPLLPRLRPPSQVRPVSSSVAGATSRMYHRQVSSSPRSVSRPAPPTTACRRRRAAGCRRRAVRPLEAVLLEASRTAPDRSDRASSRASL
jgi:hypothetical protein